MNGRPSARITIQMIRFRWRLLLNADTVAPEEAVAAEVGTR